MESRRGTSGYHWLSSGRFFLYEVQGHESQRTQGIISSVVLVDVVNAETPWFELRDAKTKKEGCTSWLAQSASAK